MIAHTTTATARAAAVRRARVPELSSLPPRKVKRRTAAARVWEMTHENATNASTTACDETSAWSVNNNQK